MAISTTDNKVTYQGNGATKEWPFSFPVLQASDMQVILTSPTGTETKLTKDYVVDIPNKKVYYPGYVSGQEPPSAEQPPILPTGWKLTLLRVVPYTQESDLGNQWPFSVIEKMVDKVTMETQQLAEEVARSVRVGLASDISPDQYINELKQARDTAITKAGEASTSAAAAATKASEASTGASTATMKASEAAVSSTSAALDAATAITKAGEATSAANTATAAATTASTAAGIATSAAATATGAASTAATKASEAANSAAIALANAGAVVTTNHIVSGGKVTAINGLTITDDTTEAVIGRKLIKADAGPQTLEAKRQGVRYLKSDATRGIVYASDPVTFVDQYTVGLWKPDGSALCPNLAVGVNGNTVAVANNLVKSGTVNAVDGLFGGNAAQGDGTTGYYVSQNSTGLPVGTAEREMAILYTPMTNGTEDWLCGYGPHATSNAMFILVVTNGRLRFNSYNALNVDTGFDFVVGTTYLVVAQYESGVIKVLVSGQLVATIPYAIATTASNFFVFGNATYHTTKGVVHLAEIRNKCRTPEQIAQISNKLCLPCTYTDSAGKRKDIREILPSDAISLGFVRTSSTGILEIVDASNPGGAMPDWAYGMRIGINGVRNRRKFLGWKYFNTGGTADTPVSWQNPFATRKLKQEIVWAQDATGANESTTEKVYFNGSNWYGIYGAVNTASQRIGVIACRGGVTSFNGVYQTSGYLGCYAEVLEDVV